MAKTKILNAAVVVSALGYFVDIYDLLLFSIVRVPSLKDIGVPDEQILSVGLSLLNWQMTGLLVGGVIWGVWGDVRGRLSVLFGSIFLYSIANIANGFVNDIHIYMILRFLAGVGLAGELGAAITLVSEVMDKETRGYGTTIVASFGILGAVVAALIGDLFNWRVAFWVGGGMGLMLLVLRMSMFESGMFEALRKQSGVRRGNLLMLFHPLPRFLRYARCILIGVPIWFVIGILMTFAPELARALGVTAPITGGNAIMYSYIGLSIGDFASGYISQIIRSRKKVVLGFVLLTAVLIVVYCFSHGWSPTAFYTLCVALGFSTGYWAVFVTTAAEHFGTNLRATVTTTTPNFVRGSVVIITWGFRSLIESVGILHSALIVGLICIAIALIAYWGLEETHGRDLDFLER